MAKFDKEIFDKVKKGDSIKVTFDSGINRGSEKELLVKSKNLVGKGKSYESEKITFSNVANPNGVKYYAYKRKDGSVGFAIGDMAISNVQIADKYAKGGSVEKENAEMVLNNNKQIAHHTKELQSALKGKKVPAWVVAKVNRSASDLSDATHYLEGSEFARGGNMQGFCYTIGGL